MNINLQISKELNIKESQVVNVVNLLDQGATVPFISRYRKEATGELDEVYVLNIKESLSKYREIEKRKDSILKTLTETNNLTDDLKQKIIQCVDMSTLEDLYLPYKPKRKTRGIIAREAGLEPVAESILLGKKINISDFINDGFKDEESIFQGARDIIAEKINEDLIVRTLLKKNFKNYCKLYCRVVSKKKEEAIKYTDYFDYVDDLKRIPSHRFLAILRGVSEGFLKINIDIDQEDAISIISKCYQPTGIYKQNIVLAIEDGYKRLLQPSIENEFKNLYKDAADRNSINVFQLNLRELLLSPPLGQKTLMAIDPGIRTGSKVVCLNKQGAYLENALIKPLPPHNLIRESSEIVLKLVKKYSIEVIAIGNGTGGREIEDFCKKLNLGIPIIMVSESGASIYSASSCARDEFPNLDLTVRGAISIGRRLMDPLAELVKIDPKSIGVGQYQHDVDQKLLKESLENTVVSCVNSVGVEINTASKELLSYVSGLNKKSAENIISYRDQVGSFKNRMQLLEVKGFGQKTFEQAAGFLRVKESSNPLDCSGVHPESYFIVEKIANDNGVDIKKIINNKDVLNNLDLSKYVSKDIGLPTLKDIIQELLKPGRDPRKSFEFFEFDQNLKDINDLKEGIIVPGIVTNVTAFGAFIDIGVHQDGLVHISQLSNKFVSEPSTVVKPGDKVSVKIIEVDIKRRRISLSMKNS